MRETMTPKERWNAAIDMKEVDRLPFWPKLGGAYRDFRGERFKTMSLGEINDWIGSDRHVWLPMCVVARRTRCSLENEVKDGFSRFVYKTPVGSLEMVYEYDETTRSYHPVKHPVRTVEDVKIMTAFCEDESMVLDEEKLEKANCLFRNEGENVFFGSSNGTSPLMDWIEHLAGIEMGHYLLQDAQEEVEALFAVMHRNLTRICELQAEHNPADVSYMVENTSTTLISPDQYRRYCVPHIRDYAAAAKREGKRMVLHMCGHLKALLPDLSELDVRAFEAFTSPTLGDVTLLDGRTVCPDKCLIGGTNATLWTKPVAEIIECVERYLDELPHHRGIVVTSAGVMPPITEPETIKAVADWVKAYVPRMN